MFDTNCFLTREDTKGKYIFWDIDGTLSPYRYNGHLQSPDGMDNGMSMEEIDNGIFLTKPISQHILHIIKTSGAKKHIALGCAISEKEVHDKHIWLDKNFPMIEERFFILDSKQKYEVILEYCKEHNISLSDVLFVDDTLKHLRPAETHGIKAYHISSLMDWDY